MQSSSSYEFDWVSGCGRVKKKIITRSPCYRHPVDKDECSLTVLEANWDDENGIPVVRGSQLSLVVGEADDELKRYLQLVLYTMAKLEVAKVEMSTSRGVRTTTIQLDDFQSKGTPVHRMSPEELSLEADRLKGISSQLIQAGRFEAGAWVCLRGVRLACWAGEAGALLYCSLVANLSLCYLKGGRPRQVLTLCSKVLLRQPRHVKSLLRRAAALDSIDDPSAAALDLHRALQIEPHNEKAKELLDKVKTHLLKQKTDYTILVKKMLQVKDA